MSVDFPEPEGPQTTTTSPFATSVEQVFSTWKLPYHLLTFLIEIIGAPSSNNRQALLHQLDAAGPGNADCEVNRRGEQVHFHQPPVAVGDFRRRPEKIGGGNHIDER